MSLPAANAPVPGCNGCRRDRKLATDRNGYGLALCDACTAAVQAAALVAMGRPGRTRKLTAPSRDWMLALCRAETLPPAKSGPAVEALFAELRTAS